MSVTSQVFETSASTNSATWAAFLERAAKIVLDFNFTKNIFVAEKKHLIKKLLILTGAILACIFLIELTLSFNNPFVKNESKQNEWKHEPAYNFVIEAQNFTTRNNIFLLSNFKSDSIFQNNWLEKVLLQNPKNSFVQLADISNNSKYLFKPKSLENYLKEYLPNTLILQLNAGIIENTLPIPNFNFIDEEKKIPILTTEPELYKSIKSLYKLQTLVSDSTIFFNPFQTNTGYKDSFPALSSKLLKKSTEESEQIVKTLKRLKKTCNKEGINLIIIPSPILWDETKRDRYSKMPLNSIVLENQTPTAWYATLYYTMLEEIKSSLPNDIVWIELYKSFPNDSRFYLDGFRLNAAGQQMFAEMYIGRIPTHRNYKAIF